MAVDTSFTLTKLTFDIGSTTKSKTSREGESVQGSRRFSLRYSRAVTDWHRSSVGAAYPRSPLSATVLMETTMMEWIAEWIGVIFVVGILVLIGTIAGDRQQTDASGWRLA